MHLFFQIQNLHLLIFYMDDQEFLANLDYPLYGLSFMFSFVTLSKLFIFIIFLLLISYFSPTKTVLVPYAYVSIESIDCILL